MYSYTALILAAGYSSRMGSHKPLLPLGRGTVLESQIELAQLAGICSPIVVTGFRADELLPITEKLGAMAVLNHSYNEGMFSSVKAGLNDFDRNLSAFFVLPVDIPLVTADILIRLAKTFEESGALIVYPVCNGHRGHPPLISSGLIPEILSHDGGGGLRRVLERHDDKAMEFETGEEGILLDMDTPEAYEDIKRRWALRQIPSI